MSEQDEISVEEFLRRIAPLAKGAQAQEEAGDDVVDRILRRIRGEAEPEGGFAEPEGGFLGPVSYGPPVPPTPGERMGRRALSPLVGLGLISREEPGGPGAFERGASALGAALEPVARVVAEPPLRAAAGLVAKSGELAAIVMGKTVKAEELHEIAERQAGQAFRQIAAPFLTAEVAGAEPLTTGGEVLGELGVPAGPSLGILGSTRSFVGFGLELFLPVTPGTGAVIRAGAGAVKATAKATLRGSEKLVERGTPLLSEVAGVALEMPEAFSRRFALRHFQPAAAGVETAEAETHLAMRAVGAEARSMMDEIRKAAVARAEAVGDPVEEMTAALQREVRQAMETPGVEEVIAGRAGVALPEGIPTLRAVAEARAAPLDKWAEKFEEAADKLFGRAVKIRNQAGRFDFMQFDKAFPLIQKAEKKFAAAEAARLEAVGARARAAAGRGKAIEDEKFAESLVSSLKPDTRRLTEQWYLGDPVVAGKVGMGLGKIERESILLRTGVLDGEAMLGFRLKFPDIAHVRHEFRSPRQATLTLLREIKKELPEQADAVADEIRRLGLSEAPMGRLKAFSRMMEKARAAPKTRELAGKIDELVTEFGAEAIESDIAKLVFLEGRQVAEAGPAFDFIRRAANIYGTPVPRMKTATGTATWARTLPGHIVVTEEILARIPKGLKAAFLGAGNRRLAIPEPIWREIKPALNTLAEDMGFERIRRAWAGWTRLFPAMTVATFPDTITRNMFGGFFNNVMAFGPAKALLGGRQAVRVLRGPEVAKTVRVEGREAMPYAQFMREATLDGARGRGLTGTLAGHVVADSFMSADKTKLRRLFSLRPAENLFVTGGFAIQQLSDDLNRMTHYILTRQAKGREAARREMGVWQYDFASLDTPFQRGVARGLMPFFAWARWNIPASVRQFVAQPRRLLATHFRLNDQGEVEIPPDLLPPWIQQQAHVATGYKDGRLSVFLGGSWVPFETLQEIDSLKKFVNFWLRQLTPLIREPLQQAFNWDLYFQRAIEDGSGRPDTLFGMKVSRRQGHALRSLRPINWLDRTFSPQAGETTWDEVVKDLTLLERTGVEGARLLGLREYRVDLFRAKRRLMAQYDEMIGKWRGRLRELASVPDRDDAELQKVVGWIQRANEKKAFALHWEPRDDLKLRDAGIVPR